MKKLIYVLLLAIAMLSLATPVYAQEGYPVDDPVDDPVYDPKDESIERSNQMSSEVVADQPIDVPAGGEGPSVLESAKAVFIFFSGIALLILSVAVLVFVVDRKGK